MGWNVVSDAQVLETGDRVRFQVSISCLPGACESQERMFSYLQAIGGFSPASVDRAFWASITSLTSQTWDVEGLITLSQTVAQLRSRVVETIAPKLQTYILDNSALVTGEVERKDTEPLKDNAVSLAAIAVIGIVVIVLMAKVGILGKE